LIPSRSWDFFLLVTTFRPALGPTQPPIQWLTGFFPWRKSNHGMKLTTPLHLVLELRMHGATVPLPSTSSWCGA